MVLDACMRAFHYPEQLSAIDATCVITFSPDRLSKIYPSFQVFLHHQPHNTPLYRLVSSLAAM